MATNFIRLTQGIGGNVPHLFHFQPGDLVEWNDPAEVDRMVERGIAEAISPAQLAELKAGGKSLKRHPLLSAKPAVATAKGK